MTLTEALTAIRSRYTQIAMQNFRKDGKPNLALSLKQNNEFANLGREEIPKLLRAVELLREQRDLQIYAAPGEHIAKVREYDAELAKLFDTPNEPSDEEIIAKGIAMRMLERKGE